MKSEKIFYYKKENGERAAARNFGIRKALGDYITFLDSDDILYPNALLVAAESIKEKNHPFFLHLGYEIGTKEKIFKKIDHIKDNDPLLLRDGNPLSCMGVFIKKEVTDNFFFNEDRELTGSEDWEFWLRLAANFGLRTDNHIIGRLIEHDARSVVNVTEEQLLKRKELSFHYAFSDPAVQKVYSPYRKRMEAFWNIYLALHLAMSKKKKRALKYLTKSFTEFPGVLFRRRFFSVIKKILA
jgi:glycosyltransferase involved in cell wall biosynthesis